MAGQIAEPFNKAANDFRTAGVTVGNEAIQIGETFKGQYAGESPPEPSNAITEFLESFDRDTYVQNWRQAKTKAAGDVAVSYRDGLINNANEKANELSTSQSEVLKGMQNLGSTTRTELEVKYNAALQELSQSEQSALETATQALNSQLQSIDQNLNTNLASLDQMQATQLSQLDSLGQQQKLGINAQAGQVTAALQQGVNQATTNLQGAFQQFANQAQGIEAPNVEVINSVIAEAQGQLDSLMATTQTELETGINNSEQGIVQQAQQTVGSINTAGQQAASSGSMIAQEFTASMTQEVQSATQAFTQLQNGHTNAVKGSAQKTAGEFKNLTGKVQQQLDGVVQNLTTKLGESVTQLENGLRGSLKGSDQNPSIEKAIDDKAKEAADQVQPAWKSVVKVLIDIVITVAVTVAIAALAASGVGLVAAIGLAALIGATGALVKQGANDLIDGKLSSWQTYATQAGFGAVGGVLQLVGLRGAEKAAGLLTNTAGKTGAKFGIEALGEAGADISQRLAAGEQFSLAMLGVSFGTSLLGGAGGEALNGAFGKLGAKLGVNKIDNAALKTGGEFVTDSISETATDVTSQVVFEGKDLSWQTVGESAGTSAFGNLAGRGANRAYGDRLRNLGSRSSTSTDVPNLNQPLPPVADISPPTQIIDPNSNQPVGQTPAPTQIIDPNTNQPVGETPVQAPIIDPNTNQPIGQTPVQTPIKDEGLTQTPSDQIKDTSLNPDLQQSLIAALPNDLQGKVPINVDPELPSNTVRVHYDVDANGLVTNVHMRVGPNASAVDIQLHTQTVRLMQRYSGFSGRIRILKERIQNWMSKNGTPPVGSRAWEAKLEVEKLPRIIDERLERLGTGGLDVDAETNLRADLENLQQQLTQHQQTLDEMDTDPGRGFVAADGNEPVNKIEQDPDSKNTEQDPDAQPKKNESELLQQLNAAVNLRLSQKQLDYLAGNAEGNPLTTIQIKKLMEHTQNDWKQVKENYLKYPKLMEQLVDYRQAEVQKLINEVKAGLKEEVDVVFQDKQGGRSIRQIAAGSTDLSSDYDIVFYSKNKAKAIQAVTLFNEKFRNKFEREAGFVFDTNVYTPGFLPDAAYSPTAARLSKLQDLQRTFNERDKNEQKLKEKEQALRELDQQENSQESQIKRVELETEITKLQSKLDSLNEKVTDLQTEVRSLTRNLKLKPENLDSPAVVKQEIERFSAELDKQYQSEKKRNAAADVETDAVVVADQDVMSLAQQRRNMNEQEWNTFQEETLAGIEPGSELQKQTSDRFQKANEVYTLTRAALDAEIIAQNKRKDPEHSDPSQRKVEPEDDVEAIKAQNPNAEIEASNLLYTQRLEEVKTILEQLEPLRDKRRSEPLNEQENKRLNELTVEWNKKQSEALIFANQAYYTGGAAQHVVGNQQMSLGRKLTPEEYLNSFNEQVSYALEHITDQEGLGHALWTSGKYLDRATDAVDQLTQLEKLLDSSPINIDERTKDRVKGLREMAQEMLKIKKGKEPYAELSPDQKGEKAIEVAQKYQSKYGFELNDINGMRQEFIRLSIEINQQVRRQGESYKTKNSFDPEGGNQQNSTPPSEVNPSDHQSAHTDESKAEPSISNQKTSEGQEKAERENDSQLKTDEKNEQSQEISPLNHPGVELHNHFTGVLKPAKIIELTGKHPSDILTELWNNSSGSTKTVIGEVLKKNGILEADAESLNLSNLRVVEVTVLELLTARTIPFDETYRIRGSVLLSTTPEQQVRATLEQLKADGIKYAELQGGLPRGIDPDQFKELLKEYGLEVRFLEIISSERLASEQPIKETALIAKPERKALEQVGNGQSIGIDIAGAERRFTSEGMKRFKKIYEHLKQKAIEQNSTFVLRPHVGEGYPKRDNTGQLDENSDEHRTIAQDNLELLINTLEELKANNELSDKVIVRLGHATHATPEQLTRIQQLGIIVEANLTSNVVTRTVADSVEQNQVLLKFLFHDVKTVLNTDAGGVMSTSLQREYELAHTIMDRFNNNEIPIVVDNVHYYFSQIPDEGDREPGVEYKILPQEKRRNFDLERLRKEAEGYSQKMQSNPNTQS
jgi:adenosine deaminase